MSLLNKLGQAFTGMLGSVDTKQSHDALKRVAIAQAGLKSVHINASAQEAWMRESVVRAVKKRGVRSLPPSLIQLAKELVAESLFFSNVNRYGTISPDAPLVERAQAIQWANDIDTALRNLPDFKEATIASIAQILFTIMRDMPDSAITYGPEGYDVTIHSMMSEFGKSLQRSLETIVFSNNETFHKYGAMPFPVLATEIDTGLKKIARLDPVEEWGSKPIIWPTDLPKHTDRELLNLFAQNTPFLKAFNGKIKFKIDPRRRVEHTHIIGAAGSGKTQLLQHMICEDLDERLKSKLSVILLDSEGGITNKVLSHPYFAPGHPSHLYERLRIIDPAKPEGIPGFNIFNMAGAVASLSPAERDKVINNAATIVAYSLNALSKTPLTGAQDTVLFELIRMLHYVKGANWDLASECLRDPDLANKLAAQAPKYVQDFFANDFIKFYKDRRQEVSSKLLGLVRSEAVKAMLQDRTDRFDFLKSINDGDIIIIKADKDHLGSEMAVFFGRLLIAMIHQAILPRNQNSPTPCYFYIDEAWEYLGDDRLKFFYAEARKRGLGLVLAHHTFAQTNSEFRSIIQTSTSIKICGNVSRDDARIMGSYMRIDPDSLLQLQKVDFKYSEFAVNVLNQTNKALILKIPHGTLEQKDGFLPHPMDKPWPPAPIRTSPKSTTQPGSNQTKNPTGKPPGFSRIS